MKNLSHSYDFLKQLGLSDPEIKVYTSLLSAGESLIMDIAKKSGLHRPMVYQGIEGLKKKGLIRTSSKGKRLTYIAESPGHLETLFKNIEHTFFNNIEDLHQIYETSKTKLTVSMSEGEDAIRNTYSDVVNTLGKNDTYYRYSSIYNFKKKKFVPKNYEEIRDKKGLERLVITGSKNVPNKKLLGRSVKIIPPEFDLFQDEINVIIFKDKVAIIDYPSKTTMTIKHKKFAEFQKKLFKLLYSKL
jgi:sugar-specific transcriptional regulator TrmB